ncbi:MAG: PHP domain-containing protein [Chloroflexaceae bacterium]|nr:PHP domain-containing protein [Chloroflexaceae bacterium]
MATFWSKADLHIHTNYSSDALATVEDVLDYAANQTNLRVLAITDHNAIDGALEAHRLARAYGLEVVVGEEVSTTEGHLLALFLEHFVPPGRSAAETIAAVHAQGGLCVAAHPYGLLVPSMGWKGLRTRSQGPSSEWPLDGLECFNASLRLPSNNATARSVCQRLNLAHCGGSDSHHLSTIGLGYTLFPGSTAEDLRRAIQMRQTRAEGMPWGVGRTVEYLRLKAKSMIRDLTGRAFRPSIP